MQAELLLENKGAPSTNSNQLVRKKCMKSGFVLHIAQGLETVTGRQCYSQDIEEPWFFCERRVLGEDCYGS